MFESTGFRFFLEVTERQETKTGHPCLEFGKHDLATKKRDGVQQMYVPHVAHLDAFAVSGHPPEGSFLAIGAHVQLPF